MPYIYGKKQKIRLKAYIIHILKSLTQKIFGEKSNYHFKHIIIISIKDVIYQKRKKGDKMYLQDVKRSILKNLHILKTQESLRNTV